MDTPNIILISIDTLRADHLSCYGHHMPTTPNIDKLAGDGTIYKQNYSTGVWTPPGHASMLTGLYVSEHGVYGSRKLPDNIPTIATALKEHGYQTAGFVNNSQVGQLVNLHKGHDLFQEVWRGTAPASFIERVIGAGKRKLMDILGLLDMGASMTNDLFKSWMDKLNQDKPFYAFLHYIEPHNPLNPVRPFRDQFMSKSKRNINMKTIEKVAYNPLICFVEELNINSDEVEYLKSLYDGEIAYIDSKVGEIVRILKENGIYDNTMIVITSDHGEHFGEYGLWSHAASLHEEVLHVPLIIKYPRDIECHKEVEGYTQLVDIFPTVMEVAGAHGKGDNSTSGVSLVLDRENGNEYHKYIFAEWEGRVPSFIANKSKNNEGVVSLDKIKLEMSMVQDIRHKYVMKSDGVEELYDISSGKEVLLDIAENRDTKDTLERELLKRVKDKSDGNDKPDYDVDDEIAKNLKSLGYM